MGKRGRPPKIKTEETTVPSQEFVGDEESVSVPVPSGPIHDVIKEMADRREFLSASLTETIDLLSRQMATFLELEQTIYMHLSQPDALFSDCIISPAFTKEWCRQQLYASGLKFGEDIWEGEISVRPFSERIKAATPWIMRFATEPVKKKTGIDAIVEEQL